MLSDLRDKPFDRYANSDQWEHLAKFHETTPMYQPECITEDQVKLQLFSFSLVGRAKDWLLCLSNWVIKTLKELEDKYLERFFTTAQFIERKANITQFEKQETRSLNDAWERFKLLICKCPDHNMSDMEQMQNFVKGLQAQVQMLLDASTCGTIRTLTEPQVKEMIDKISLNEYSFANTIGLNTLETNNKSHSDYTRNFSPSWKY